MQHQLPNQSIRYSFFQIALDSIVIPSALLQHASPTSPPATHYICKWRMVSDSAFMQTGFLPCEQPTDCGLLIPVYASSSLFASSREGCRHPWCGIGSSRWAVGEMTREGKRFTRSSRFLSNAFRGSLCFWAALSLFKQNTHRHTQRSNETQAKIIRTSQSTQPVAMASLCTCLLSLPSVSSPFLSSIITAGQSETLPHECPSFSVHRTPGEVLLRGGCVCVIAAIFAHQ